MKQIKIFTGYIDYSNDLEKLEKTVNEWLSSHTDYAILDIKQSITSGHQFDQLVITVFYEVSDQLEEVNIKQKEYSNYRYRKNYEDLNDNEYMSR